MIPSRDTWWVNRFTKERAWVPGRQTAYRSESIGYRGGHTVCKPLGRRRDHLILIPEGRERYPLWYTKEELRALYRPLRLKKDLTYVPDWVKKGKFQDFLLTVEDEDFPLWVALQRIRSGWLCLSAIVQDEVTTLRESQSGFDPEKKLWEHPFDWSLQRYNTFFLPASEAIPRLKPRFGSIPFTVYDRITEAADEEDEEAIPPPPQSEPHAVGRIAHLREVLDVKIRPRKKKAS